MKILKRMKKTYQGGKVTDVYFGDVRMPHYHGVRGSVHAVDGGWSVGGALPDGRVYEIVVGDGFTFDGCSTPRFLWRITGHPLEVPRVAAALAHDWAYLSQLTSRKTADRIYRDICRQVGMSRVRAFAEYLALRVFGWLAWDEKDEEGMVFARTHGAIWVEGVKL